MHVHGGRQEGKYKGRKNLASTHGCMRINDDDMLEIQKITTTLEQNDPLEKNGYLNLIDDLTFPVEYSTSSSTRKNTGTNQIPKDTDMFELLNPPLPIEADHTKVVILIYYKIMNKRILIYCISFLLFHIVSCENKNKNKYVPVIPSQSK
jgi:hypothetical protein